MASGSWGRFGGRQKTLGNPGSYYRMLAIRATAASILGWAKGRNTLPPPLLTRSCIDYFERLSGLLRDPVYYGLGVRKGAGEPVLLIPGFFAGAWMMAAMARWLARIGYRPYLSGLDLNRGCSRRKVDLF